MQYTINMQSQQDIVLTHRTIDMSKIVYDDIIMTQNDQFAVAKIWYQPSSDKMQSLLYQTSVLPLYSYSDKTNKFHLRLSNETEQNIFSEIDKLSINYIKSTGLLKRLSLSPQKVRYRTLVTDFVDKENEKINSIELKNTLKTKYYANGIKKTKTLEDVENLLKKDANIKVIIEFDGLVVDIKRESIITNVILHQFRVEKIIPKKIELCEYSFLDSDNEEEDNDNEANNETLQNEIITQVNENLDEDTDGTNDEEMVQQIATNNITEIDDENELSSDCNESEGNSYEEESSDDVDVEEFVSKLKQTQPVKQVEVKKQETPPKPKRGRPSSKK